MAHLLQFFKTKLKEMSVAAKSTWHKTSNEIGRFLSSMVRLLLLLFHTMINNALFWCTLLESIVNENQAWLKPNTIFVLNILSTESGVCSDLLTTLVRHIFCVCEP
mmetsp:Transcript_48086/g.48477  ORF Transcript_48086/g.48477 Transcript_48086/m.48477 type:complete len:106 (-) Transcript_48086:38-355(-)